MESQEGQMMGAATSGGKLLHVLILPSLMYQTEYLPFAGIFQKHQADGLHEAGCRVGVLSAGLIPFSGVLKPNRYRRTEIKNESGVTVARRFDRAWLPQRFIGPGVQEKAMIRLGLEAFGEYVKACGTPDILHVHDCLYAGLLAMKIKSAYGVPYIVTEHSTMHQRGLYSPEQQVMIGSVLSEASAVTAVGSGLQKKLNETYGHIPAVQNMTIIFNMLDREFENMKLPAEPAAGGPFVFLNVAHLVEQKRQIDLIRAMPAVLARHPQAELRIGGAGYMQPQLEQAVGDLGLQGKVMLLGRLGRAEVKRQMAECSAFVLSSRVETFGVVLIEAMAMGKPVVATVCGGPEDFVDDACGYLVPPQDVEKLSEAMVRMIDTRGRFDAAAIRAGCISRFGRESFVSRLVGIYEAVLAGAAG